MRHDDTASAVRRIVMALQFTSPDTFRLAGRDHGIAPSAFPSLGPQSLPIVTRLRDVLYEQAYVKPLDAAPPNPSAAWPGFAQLLSQANAGRDRWHEGWQIESALPGGQVRARRHELVRTWWPGEYLVRDGLAASLRPQAPIGVLQSRESHAVQSGFYFAFGEAIADEEDEARLLRLYWNVTPAGAPALLTALTRVLNRFEIPFRFKCVNAAEHYGRSDAAVLYIGRRFYRVVAELLPAVLQTLTPLHLLPTTPLFTLRLRPGLALAEDPLGGESFGMHRCRLLAEGLWAAHSEGLADGSERLARVLKHFEAQGIPLDRCHLNPGSTFEAVLP